MVKNNKMRRTAELDFKQYTSLDRKSHVQLTKLQHIDEIKMKIIYSLLSNYQQATTTRAH